MFYILIYSSWKAVASKNRIVILIESIKAKSKSEIFSARWLPVAARRGQEYMCKREKAILKQFRKK